MNFHINLKFFFLIELQTDNQVSKVKQEAAKLH